MLNVRVDQKSGKVCSQPIKMQWVLPKKMRSPPTEEISAVQRGGGRDCLKNVLNFYRMSGEREVGYCQFPPCGGGGYMDLFWNNPIHLSATNVMVLLCPMADNFTPIYTKRVILPINPDAPESIVLLCCCNTR